MSQIQLSIGGMNCGHCVKAVQGALAGVPGVRSHEVKVGSATVEFDESVATPETIRRAIRKGYLRATAPAAGPGHGKFRIARSELDRWIRGEPDATDYLLQSPANAARLLEAVHDHRAGRNLQERDLLPDAD